MKRMGVLFGQRRLMVLVTLTVLVLAAAALVASSASFTATSANPDNIFTSGSLSITNDKDVGVVHHAVLTATGMAPGDSKDGKVVIGNGGTVSGKFTLDSTTSGDADFAAYLDLVVEQDGTSIYTGKLDGLTTAINLIGGASWAPSVTHAYKITVTFPNGAAGNENALMNKSATLDLAWAAVSD